MTSMDNKLLRELNGPGCLSFFRSLRLHGFSEAQITARLLDVVQTQSVPPVPVMSVWLSFAQSPATLKLALNQKFSRRTRKFALKGFGRMLKRPQWMQLWIEFGGVEGIQNTFTHLSVQEVHMLTSIIGHQIKAGHDAQRDAKITELVAALTNDTGEVGQRVNPDQRHLQQKYVQMLPACTSDFVERFLRLNSSSTWDLKYLRPHSALIATLTKEATLSKDVLTHENLETCLSFCLKNMQQGYRIEPGFTMSLSFALDLLKSASMRLPTLDLSQAISASLFASFDPLMKHTWARRKILGLPKLEEVLDLAISAIEKFPQSPPRASPLAKRLLGWAIQFWSLDTNRFESHLTRLFWVLRGEKTAESIFDLVRPSILLIDVELRYRLLRKLFMEVSPFSTDLNSREDLSRLDDNWGVDLIDILSQGDAVPLLQRLRQAKSDLRLLTSYRNINARWGEKSVIYYRDMRDKADLEMFYHLLNRGRDGALASASKFLTQQKQKAMTSRDQLDRERHAGRSLFAAVASGSFSLVSDTMIWLQRYVRDPLTVKTLFSEPIFNTIELIDILAGVPEIPSRKDSPDSVAEAVRAANAILETVYETACQALREPSFFADDWRSPLSLFGIVVKKRYDRVKNLQRALRLSDEKLYDVVWKDTLRLLIDVEKSAVEPGNSALKFNDPTGPLHFGFISFKDLKRATPAFYRFLDKLAEARDQIWRAKRRLEHPTAAVLAEPWPRGLSLRHMVTNFDIETPKAHGWTQYLSFRAKSLVFLPKSAAVADIPTDKETLKAISGFGEDYKQALSIFVHQESSPQAKKLLIQQAWKHALQSFTRYAMTEDEKIRYVNEIFKDSLPTFASEFPSSSIDHAKVKLYPLLPDDLDAMAITEWDPSETKPDHIAEKQWPAKAIDCILPLQPAAIQLAWGNPVHEKAIIQKWYAPPIWSIDRFKPSRVPQKVKEALILSKLLYLDGKIGGVAGLLSRPFPSLQDVRFAPIFLDSEFLLKEDLGTFNLAAFMPDIPLDLVRRLADSALEQLIWEEAHLKALSIAEESSTPEGQLSTSTVQHNPQERMTPAAAPHRSRGSGREQGKSHKRSRTAPNASLTPVATRRVTSTPAESKARIMELERILYELVALLAGSDRPQLASKLSLHILLDRPEASSWHRSLLGVRRLQVLPPDDVNVFFADFFDGLSQRLADQEAHKDDKNWNKPYVKVTTLKLVAQLLKDAEFISRIDAVSVLIKLYRQATHIDVRVAAVESLVAMLVSCGDEKNNLSTAKVILSGLKATISLLGGPSERKEVTEADWFSAETDGVLPEVRNDTPIWDQLVRATAGHLGSIALEYRKEIASQILNPIIAASSLSNKRWMTCFASKNGVALDSDDTTSKLLDYPIKPSMIETMLVLCPDLTPLSILQKHQDRIHAFLNLPPTFQILLQKVKNDIELRSSQEGQTFRHLYDHQPNVWRDATQLFSLLRNLFRSSPSSSPLPSPNLPENERITLTAVQTMLYRLATAFLARFATDPDLFDTFIRHLKPDLRLDHSVRDAWTQRLRPVLEALIAHIDDTRFHLTPHSAPSSVLPNTFELKLWLLTWPTVKDNAEVVDLIPLAREILHAIFYELAGGGGTGAGNLIKTSLPYHARLYKLSDLLRELPTVEIRVRLALQIQALLLLEDRKALGMDKKNELSEALIREVQEMLLRGEIEGTTATVQRGLVDEVAALAEKWTQNVDEEVRRSGFAVKRAWSGVQALE